MNGVIKVVKIGGNVVDDPIALQRFISDFAKLDVPKILVHGGGKEATRLSDTLGFETVMVNGRRVTDANTIDVVTMVYAGLINKRIVSRLQAAGVNAIGLSGADAGVICATCRSPEPVDYGFVGDINPADIKSDFIGLLLNAGIVPVFCAINHDGNGQLLNCNADSVASAVAVAMSHTGCTELIYCFEKPGVLYDVDDEGSLIDRITPEIYAGLRADGVVVKGMIPKIDNAFASVNAGVKRVLIKHAENLLNETGTEIKNEN